MQRIKYRISLDMLEVASQTTIKAKKGDTACSIVMTLTENGKIYHIADGCRAVFSGKKSDGNYLFNGETCRIEDNTIIYDFTEQTVPIEGIVECEVILYKDNEQLTTPRFNILVGATVYNDEEIVSTPEADALKELIEESESRVNGLIEEGESLFEEIEIAHKNNSQVFANALKGTASGTEVTMKDVSPLQHNINVALSNSKVIAEGLGYESNYLTFDGVSQCIITRSVVYMGHYLTILTSDGEHHNIEVWGKEDSQIKLSLECIIEGTKLKVYKKAFNYRFQIEESYDPEEFNVAEGSLIEGVAVTNEAYVEENAEDFYLIVSTKYDYTDVKLYRSGKNLLDARHIVDYNKTSEFPGAIKNVKNEYILSDGENFTIRGNEKGGIYAYDSGQLMFPYSNVTTISEKGLQVKAGVTYTVSFDYLLLAPTGHNYNISVLVYIPNVNKPGEVKLIYGANSGNNLKTFEGEMNNVKRYSFTITPTEDTKISVCFRINGNWVRISNVQIEEGNKTDFEPYITPTEYTPNADGIVTVPSLYPSTRLYTDAEGVTMDAEYNIDTKKYIDNKFAELQALVLEG